MKKYILIKTAEIGNTHRTRFHRHSETCDVTMQRTNKKSQDGRTQNY